MVRFSRAPAGGRSNDQSRQGGAERSELRPASPRRGVSCVVQRGGDEHAQAIGIRENLLAPGEHLRGQRLPSGPGEAIEHGGVDRIPEDDRYRRREDGRSP